VGKYGTRYGASLRKQIKKMEVSQHSKYFCQFCGKVGTAAVWQGQGASSTAWTQGSAGFNGEAKLFWVITCSRWLLLSVGVLCTFAGGPSGGVVIDKQHPCGLCQTQPVWVLHTPLSRAFKHMDAVSCMFTSAVLFTACSPNTVRCEARGCRHLGLQGLQEDTGWWRLCAAVSDSHAAARYTDLQAEQQQQHQDQLNELAACGAIPGGGGRRHQGTTSCAACAAATLR